MAVYSLVNVLFCPSGSLARDIFGDDRTSNAHSNDLGALGWPVRVWRTL